LLEHEIFTLVLSTIKFFLIRIFSGQKNFVKLFILTLILHFIKNTRLLSICMQFVHVYWAYANKLFAYAQDTLTNHMCVWVQILVLFSAYAYKKHLEIIWIMHLCQAYPYKLFTYVERLFTNCTHKKVYRQTPKVIVKMLSCKKKLSKTMKWT